MALQSSFSSYTSSSAHPFSSSSIRYKLTYDVFISFRGPDTRLGFTGNLYNALHNKGIHTFFDDDKLQSGEEITPALLNVIQKSRIAIIVLSPNYAHSSFCLDELLHILDCIKGNNRLVLPVFWEVDPSDVRHLKESFGEAMAKHEKRHKDDINKLQKWKHALHQVANLSGYHFKHGDGYEHKFIEKIVKDISRKIRRAPLPVADYPVGLEFPVSKVISLLEMDSTDGVHMVGIHGIGGIGKTTLALAIYNLIADHFEAVCFLENVRENSQKHGLMQLQKDLLCKILGEEGLHIIGVKDGISQIQRRLCQMKVLLVLDDVDEQEQLKSIAGKPDWFGGGSRVIITTRDTHLLKLHGVEKRYEVHGLNEKDSLDLLVWKAFKIKTDTVDPKYVNVLARAVKYASGHPLALEVIGSNLSVELWESTFDQPEDVLYEKILKILKVSFDALEIEHQCIFLDITCCLKGHNLMEIKDILQAHYPGYKSLERCIKQLVDKSLIKIKVGDQVTFHDLIEHMGKRIVKQKSPFTPGDRSRLWSHKDIVQVLEGDQGSTAIEMIYLEFPLQKTDENEDSVEWDGMAFKKMEKLRTLVIKNGSFSQGPKHLPNSLRVLEWWGYPSKRFPPGFNPNLLSILRLPCYLYESFEMDSLSKNFEALNVLNFDKSDSLKEIPDVSGLVALQRLTFSGCKNLIRVDTSVGLLNNLKVLKADGCESLRSFPSINLPSLEVLMLSDCSSLETFPEIKGKMGKVQMLRLSGTKITELPSSFQNLCELSCLTLCGTTFRKIPSVIVNMPKLSTLYINQIASCSNQSWVSTNTVEEEGFEGIIASSSKSNVTDVVLKSYRLPDGFFPLAVALFRNVKKFDFTHNRFTIIPKCIQDFPFLSSLIVDRCFLLEKIEGIPPNLKHFSAVGCISLIASGSSLLLNQEVHENGNTEFKLPGQAGTRIPSWFEQRREGASISFWFRGKFPSKHLCLAILLRDWPRKITEIDVTTIVSINGKQVCGGREIRGVQQLFIFDLSATNKMPNSDDICFENQWNHAEVSYEIGYARNIGRMEFGMHILKQESSSIMEDIRFTDPSRKRKREDAQVMEGEGQQLCTSKSKKSRSTSAPCLHSALLSSAYRYMVRCVTSLVHRPLLHRVAVLLRHSLLYRVSALFRCVTAQLPSSLLHSLLCRITASLRLLFSVRNVMIFYFIFHYLLL